MRHLIFLSFSILVPTVLANASSGSVKREYELDSCHFSLIDQYEGRIDVDNESSVHSASYISLMRPKINHPIEVTIEFSCKTALGQKAFFNIGISHDNDEWSLIPEKSDPNNLTNQRIHKLHGRGVDGAAVTYDQTTGEESKRVQGLGFCLTSHKQTLCGYSEAVGYVAYPKESSLPQVLELLESIQFIDPAPEAR